MYTSAGSGGLVDGQSQDDVYVIHSAKMSALGQLMAGLVHEINTPLAYVDATFSVLGRTISLLMDRRKGIHGDAQDAELATLVSEINVLLADGRHGIGQIHKLVTSLGNFSRLDNDEMKPVDLAAVMKDALLLARNKLKYMELEQSYDDVPLVHCSASKIMQVFLNIINNATQAVEQVGADGRIGVSIGSEDGATVVVRITDNGPGMPKSAHEKIFEPFFTTKPPGEGTGLGLAICHRIIANHGGRIFVSSAPGAGTTFSITLPVEPKAPSLESEKLS